MTTTSTRNPLYDREQTLGELMTELKTRLGFVTQGSSSKLIDPLLLSFLQEGQHFVYLQLGSPTSTKRTTITVERGSKLYDPHNDIEDEDFDPREIESLHLYETATSQIALRQGITEKMRCDDITPSAPERYDILNGQIELWPTPDQEYRLVVLYRQGLARFSQAQDRPCVSSRLIFLYALASAKAHYQHNDAKTAGNIFQQALMVERSQRHMNKRYFVAGSIAKGRRQVKRLEDGNFVL